MQGNGWQEPTPLYDAMLDEYQKRVREKMDHWAEQHAEVLFTEIEDFLKTQ